MKVYLFLNSTPGEG